MWMLKWLAGSEYGTSAMKAGEFPRSRTMRAIRKRDTGPEWAVRRVLRRLGVGYRLHVSSLPGTPDIVIPRMRKVIMVHGCFWHQHHGCKLAKLPRSRPEYWLPKLARNQERDTVAEAALKTLGWDVGVLWECEVADAANLDALVAGFLRE
jgi:DNA mismatch endonuclease (patch repair protein)